MGYSIIDWLLNLAPSKFESWFDHLFFIFGVSGSWGQKSAFVGHKNGETQ